MASVATPLVWLITGCSSGFGESLTLIALKAGHRVIATSRSPSKTPELVKKVEELGGIWLELDIIASVEVLQRVVDQSIERFGKIDVLVNCAGMAIMGSFEDFSSAEMRTIYEVNVFGPMNLVQAALPSMRARRSGTIVNVSSAGGFDTRPGMTIYGSSKAALEGWSLGLSREVEHLNIRVLIVQPGGFTTNMGNAALLTDKPLNRDYKGTPMGNFLALFNERQNRFVSLGNVDKGCQGIFEAVTLTGRGVGTEKHLRLPLSPDCAQRTREHIERLQSSHDIFKSIWQSTEHDDGMGRVRAPK